MVPEAIASFCLSRFDLGLLFFSSSSPLLTVCTTDTVSYSATHGLCWKMFWHEQRGPVLAEVPKKLNRCKHSERAQTGEGSKASNPTVGKYTYESELSDWADHD